MFDLNNLLEQFKDDWEFMGKFNYSYDRYDSIESFLDNLFLKNFTYTEEEITWLCRFEREMKKLEPYEEEEWWEHYRQFFHYKGRYFCIEWLLGIPSFSYYEHQPYEVYLEKTIVKKKVKIVQEEISLTFKNLDGECIDSEFTVNNLYKKCEII